MFVYRTGRSIPLCPVTGGASQPACPRGGADCLMRISSSLTRSTWGAGVEWLQLDECGAVLLVGFPGHIDAFVTSPNISHSFKLVVSGTSFHSCVIRSDEEVLLIASSSDDEPVISAWDLESRVVIAEHPLPYRSGGGYCLAPHPEGEAMAAVAYSGQSEEWMFWAHYQT